MDGRVPCEFALVRYVPDPVRGEFVNIGAVLRGAGGALVKFTRDWSRVRCLDAEADLPMLEALEGELAASLVEAAEGSRPLLSVFEDSLSNNVQMTPMRGTLAESLPAEMEQLLRMYVEPMRGLVRRSKVSGRTAIANRMRDEFSRAGVWALMRKRIAASVYTRPGDPLKLDCGYRNGQVRMFHAVSLDKDAEAAKGLAFSAEALRDGVWRVEGLQLNLAAVVEPLASVSDGEMYRFGVDAMERAGLRVLTVADLGRAGETARRELRV